MALRRRRSQNPMAGGAATAPTTSSAVSVASSTPSAPVPAMGTTWPATFEALMGPLPEPGTTCPVTGLMVPARLPALGVGFAPGPAVAPGLVPPPGPDPDVVAGRPLTTVQLSGWPTLSQGDGCGAVLSRMFWPLMKVGFSQPPRVARFGVATWPGILSTWSRPPFTRLIGNGE